MVTVASRELKNRLGKYLRLVRKGEVVRITDRGNPIGCILPLSDGPSHPEHEMLVGLLTKGGVRLGTGNLRRRSKPAILKPGRSIAEMVAEDRR